ncbi:MAG: hypothetical protein JM58_06785 [Peptococcaceae bacterium BICA1-8]|nr:MAG: hypothetical protein JM58_06785 [Peptococcaceae bacterium BICA1-8]
MAFYELTKEERKQKYIDILDNICIAMQNNVLSEIKPLFDHQDTYFRKAAYLAVGKIYVSEPKMIKDILECLNELFQNESERIRQTVIYSCGEIAIYDFESVREFFDKGMIDDHHSVRNAVVGSLKKAGGKNPDKILPYCNANIVSSNLETRRLSCHCLELRGREHPQEIIDILKFLQYEKIKRVKDMLIHVLGQISYKKGCLFYVTKQVESWDNKEIFRLYKQEVIEVHGRYENFSEFSQDFVISYFENLNV